MSDLQLAGFILAGVMFDIGIIGLFVTTRRAMRPRMEEWRRRRRR